MKCLIIGEFSPFFQYYLINRLENCMFSMCTLKTHFILLHKFSPFMCITVEKWNSIQSELSDTEIQQQAFQCILGKNDMIWLIYQLSYNEIISRTNKHSLNHRKYPKYSLSIYMYKLHFEHSDHFASCIEDILLHACR